MAVQFRGRRIVISRPYYEADLSAWVPCVSATWHDDRGFHYEWFKDLPMTFITEEEAIAFGFKFAHRWIDSER